MNWIEVKAVFDEAPPDWSLYIDVFDRHGCENTLEEDNPPALSSAVVDVQGSGEIVERLRTDLLAAGAKDVLTRSLTDENWEENWKRFFHPRAIGERFLVRPTWESAPPSGRFEIVLDPGQAFGTGDHPTTRMCLQLLESVAMEGAKVADVGCGSGILSIGACLLGAKEVRAVDIEPLSVEVAKENAALNHVTFDTSVGRGIAALAEHVPFDVVVSNIISAVLIQIAAEVAEAIKAGGVWIVSGIIVQNWPDVKEAATAAGFTEVAFQQEDGWVAATFRTCSTM